MVHHTPHASHCTIHITLHETHDPNTIHTRMTRPANTRHSLPTRSLESLYTFSPHDPLALDPLQYRTRALITHLNTAPSHTYHVHHPPSTHPPPSTPTLHPPPHRPFTSTAHSHRPHVAPAVTPTRTPSLASLFSLDDNWQKCGSYGTEGLTYHDDAGNPIVNTDRFPDFNKMTDHAHGLGLTSGWCKMTALGPSLYPPHVCAHARIISSPHARSA